MSWYGDHPATLRVVDTLVPGYISVTTPIPSLPHRSSPLPPLPNHHPTVMTVDMEKCKRIVQYFWDPEPRNDDPATVIWCLGREYAPTKMDNASMSNDTTWPQEFISDFGSRIWITYRSNFTPIPRTKTPEATSSMTLGVRLRSQLMDSQGFTSDTGWGCMIRSGQALLANTLSILLLGRGE